MRTTPRTVLALLLACPCVAAAAAGPHSASVGNAPDPASVERFGAAYRYPQAGWIVLHVEGRPYERGFQHGRLLAPEIADYVTTLATKRSPKAPAEAWREVRTLADALFLRRYEPEYLEEMKGIADGAEAGGARFDGRPLDLLDVAAVNSDIEIEFLDDALHATATGLESRRFPRPDDTSPATAPPEHCSAFAANGPATPDGSIVFGHITMFALPFVRHFNVWLDVKPASGHRVLMQTYPGGIMSGMDYYLNDAGLLVAETTLRQTNFDIDGRALASRARKALQYSDTIDGVVATLKASNNGLYTNEWLLADTKTNEIAMFELGTHKSRLWRSSKGEWFGGTEGFYWGCNNAKDLAVRLETVASVEGKPANLVFHPSDRDRTWLRLYDKHKGTIGEGFGFEAFTTPPLAAAPSCDAKFTTSAMARGLKTWALFGPPLGRTWEPTEADRARCPTVQPLVSNDWTVVTAAPPFAGSDARRVALRPREPAAEPRRDDATTRQLEERVDELAVRLRQFGRVALAATDPVLQALDTELEAARARLDHHRGTPRPDAPEPPAHEWTRRSPVAVDLATSRKEDEHAQGDAASPPSVPLRPAWRGTILPGNDGDKWLASAFADYEPIVARELAARENAKSGDLSAREQEQLDLGLFAPHSRYGAAVRRWGLDVPLREIRSDLRRDEWYAIASGKGVLLLADLRSRLGDETFLTLMDDFGRAHAGRSATTAEFLKAVDNLPGRPVESSFFDRWLGQRGLPTARFEAVWSIDSFTAEPERAVIVYGTLKEASAQREAADLLQRQVERLWSNVTVPVRSDKEVTTEELKSHHLLLVGRPGTNAVASDRAAGAVPVAFKSGSFVVAGQTYAHPASSVIAAGENPLNPRYEVVLFAGLSARSTRECVQRLATAAAAPAEVLLMASGAKPRRMVVCFAGRTRLTTKAQRHKENTEGQ
jgi:hypothetical protein